MTMYIACCPPSSNGSGGETGAPGGNDPETAGFISFFPNWKMQIFLEFSHCFPIMSKCNGDKVFPARKTHSCLLRFEPGSLALKPRVLPLHQLHP